MGTFTVSKKAGAFVLSATMAALGMAGIVDTSSASAASVGQFEIYCNGAVKVGTFDPIVMPGMQMFGHEHVFYGNTTTDENSTPTSLVGQPTHCDEPGDAAAYWVPSVYINGELTPANNTDFYYTQRAASFDTRKMHVWPAGLEIIAGNKNATGPQGDEPVYWGCGNGSIFDKVDFVPSCPTNTRGLQVHVIFPDCWDGVHLDSADHQSHMSYSEKGSDDFYHCDAAHPVELPTLILRFSWDGMYPYASSVTFSNGQWYQFHADFMNGWDQSRLKFLFDHCIKAGIKCLNDSLPQGN